LLLVVLSAAFQAAVEVPACNNPTGMLLLVKGARQQCCKLLKRVVCSCCLQLLLVTLQLLQVA
jgi:hypothetical protein